MCILYETYWRCGALADSDISRCQEFLTNAACSNLVVDKTMLFQSLAGLPTTNTEFVADIRTTLEANPRYASAYRWLRKNRADAPKLRVPKRKWASESLRDVANEKEAIDAKSEVDEPGNLAFGTQGAESVRRWNEKQLLTPPGTPQ